jgi:hypothetical protein
MRTPKTAWPPLRFQATERGALRLAVPPMGTPIAQSIGLNRTPSLGALLDGARGRARVPLP